MPASQLDPPPLRGKGREEGSNSRIEKIGRPRRRKKILAKKKSSASGAVERILHKGGSGNEWTSVHTYGKKIIYRSIIIIKRVRKHDIESTQNTKNEEKNANPTLESPERT